MNTVTSIGVQSLPQFKNPSCRLAFSFATFRASYPMLRRSTSIIRASLPGLTIAPIIRTTCLSIVTTVAIFFNHHLAVLPAQASAVPSLMEETDTAAEQGSVKDKEKELEEHLSRNPEDTKALRSLVEVRIKLGKLSEALEVLDQLIELEPGEEEWPLLKAQIYCFRGEMDAARRGFEEILDKDPFKVEAYHGLLMTEAESGNPLEFVAKRIDMAMDNCRKERSATGLRDLKLLAAQVRVIEEKYGDALRLYEELVKEEPRDFRPYLCQGIIYTLMQNKDAAEKKFEQFKRLVPKNHPYREYFFDNLFATKSFVKKLERDTAG